MTDAIRIRGAHAHNLRGVDVDLPRRRLVAITGVSGSGKSSLAFDTVLAEGERRYLMALSSAARRLAGKIQRPEVDAVHGLGPAVAVGQRGSAPQPRSTVGTATGLWDFIRLLFARIGNRDCTSCGEPLPAEAMTCACGQPAPKLLRGLLSFNDQGACETCGGLGVVDEVDEALLVADPAKTIRGQALVPTLKNGYTVYSQVTVDVLNDVCGAHGFDVDTPWQQLTDEQRKVILYGSRRLVVPFGKHSLESRMRWSGIVAKPREEGYYRGLIPVIEETLHRNRNDNVLRFVRSVDCEDCGGTRLAPEARAVRVEGLPLSEAAAYSIHQVTAWLERLEPSSPTHAAVLAAIRGDFLARGRVLTELGLGHLPLGRSAPTLSSGERQRIRLAQQLEDDLAGLTYVLDEPAVDLHPLARIDLQAILRRLVAVGNTVLTVEHDMALVRGADHVVDIGPGPGQQGGRVLYCGPASGLAGLDTPTGRASRTPAPVEAATAEVPRDRLWVRGPRARNLAGDDIPFVLGGLNVVTGVSGAGKTTLVTQILAPALSRHLGRAQAAPGAHDRLEGHEGIDQVITLDQRPLGRTPRSNPATYTKLFDVVRKCFAQQPLARERGYAAGRFSFNTAGGRCPACEGAGVTRVGMHFLGDLTVTCPACDGRRFDDDTLEVRYAERDIHEVLDLSVDAAREVFADVPDAARILDALIRVGLGYLPIGQPATTLSGGEAQRVRLATELARAARGTVLYVLDEPTRGLHPEDLAAVLRALRALVDEGHTLVVVEHHPDVWRVADWLVDLGPGGGVHGGRLLSAGPVDEVARSDSPTGQALRARSVPPPPLESTAATEAPPIQLRGVRTHNLQGVDVDFPKDELTVVTGPSGSGKSSLVFDTLAAEASHRLVSRLSAHARRLVMRVPRPALDRGLGLTPTIALRQQTPAPQSRSTVGTLTEAQDLLRLLFSRAGAPKGRPASALSFNTERGACPTCTGLGHVLEADPTRLLTAPDRSVHDGAFAGTKIGGYFMDAEGQHAATLAAAAEALGVDLSPAFEDLGAPARDLVLRGTGDRAWTATWRFRRGKRSGAHEFTATWPGLLALVEEDHRKTHLGKSGGHRDLMRKITCESCDGGRLGPEARQVKLAGRDLADVGRMPVAEVGAWLNAVQPDAAADRAVVEVIRSELRPRLDGLVKLGLGHLALGRGSDTLSAGELQRVHLAAQLGAPMTGVTYVLDEPTRGLHLADVRALVQGLRDLCDAGNTVIVVEHSRMVLAAADRVVRLGPGAGEAGGRIVAEAPAEARRELRSPPLKPTPTEDVPDIEVRQAGLHNLKHIDVRIPGRGLTVVAGPSGSGKSSLIAHTLAAPQPGAGGAQVLGLDAHTLAAPQPGAGGAQVLGLDAHTLAAPPPGAGGAQVLDLDAHTLAAPQPGAGGAQVFGLDAFTHLVFADQVSPASGGASVLATAAGLFDDLRGIFAASPAAKAAKLSKAAFSFVAGPGRCPACKGAGRVRVELDFLADAHAVCETCQGRRYRPSVLACQVDGLSIADALDLTVARALEHFAPTDERSRAVGTAGPGLNDPLEHFAPTDERDRRGQASRGEAAGRARSGRAAAKLAAQLATLDDLGLGHLPLGRPMRSLSGGEAQRVRLAAHLAQDPKGRTLYVLDEPSRGLDDLGVGRMQDFLRRLTSAGHAVVAVTHHPGLIRAADWVIELGPTGGPDGGHLVFSGRAEELLAADTSTGRALREEARGS